MIWWLVALVAGLSIGVIRIIRRKPDRYEIDDTRAYLESISAGTTPKGAHDQPPSLLGQPIRETKAAAMQRLATTGFPGRGKMVEARLPKAIAENEAARWPGYRDGGTEC